MDLLQLKTFGHHKWRPLVCAAVVLTVLSTLSGQADARVRANKSKAKVERADLCLPNQMPSRDVLFESPRKVYAHYFNRFPLSLDNKPINEDYYATQFLNPEGEHNKWQANGGYLRARPVPVAPSADKNTFLVENLKKEILLALSRGITGFTFDILSMSDIKEGGYLDNMLDAASQVDSRFKIVLMPDMASLGKDTDHVLQIVDALKDKPNVARLPDGRLIIAPFLSESVTPEAWKDFLAKAAQHGNRVAFVPTFLSLDKNYAARYADVSDGLGTFGTPAPGELANITAETKVSHDTGKIFMAGVSGQGYRPKNFIYWEAEGSLAYRDSWMGAINGKSEWIQITTWNDFSESTQIEPYTNAQGDPGTGYFNLTGYYAAWFLRDKQPTITHDVLYYFYRRQFIGAATPKSNQVTHTATGTENGKDIIELVGFLTKPGTLTITIGDQTFSNKVDAGLQTMTIPLSAGLPHFSLTRRGKKIISFDGKPEIHDAASSENGYPDFTYWSGGAYATGSCFPSIPD